MAVVRILPTWLVKGFFLAIAELHFRLRRDRRGIVVRNLLPPLAGNRAAADRTAHRLYRRFAVKMAELWKLESGAPVQQWLTAPEELEIIRAACARGRGVLFVTLHLGNWEHGGLLLSELGIKLTVLTLAEPDNSLTRLRVASRARWGIQTILIGESDFAFVEVIKQLQAGTNMALSLDRPPKKSAAEIELFGQRFGASTAAAELARASGCALIGVTIVRRPEGFAVKVLPEFTYDRQALGNREARRQLTQQILRAFEPQIQQHLDQWYQFVPIWPDGK
jgi:lauroyl/myristoyl acyltransferase